MKNDRIHSESVSFSRQKVGRNSAQITLCYCQLADFHHRQNAADCGVRLIARICTVTNRSVGPTGDYMTRGNHVVVFANYMPCNEL